MLLLRFMFNPQATNASKWAVAAAVDPENIAILPGASAVIDWATFLLTNQGDSVLIPSPYYAQLVDMVVRC